MTFPSQAQSHVRNLNIGIPHATSQASRKNENWFEKSGVREIEAELTV